MRTSTLLLPILVGAFLVGVFLQVPAQAQTRRALDPVPAGFTVPALQLDEGPAGPQWHHRVLTAFGAAALGAGIGYFASQLARGDWDDGPGQPKLNRPVWAAVGGSVGLGVPPVTSQMLRLLASVCQGFPFAFAILIPPAT